MQSFRLALVGAGLITENSHLPAALASTRITVAAIVDPVVGRASALARKYGINPLIASDIEEVVSDVDGAVIATPNNTHRSIAVRCLGAGISVLIEKPLATTYEDGAAILEAAERSRRIVAVGYCTRFRQSTVLMKQLLDQNFFGKVTAFYHQFGGVGGWAPVSGYVLNRVSAGGGVLVITGTHFLDRMLHLWGYPDQVNLAHDGSGGPEANAIASFRYERGPASLEGKVRYSKTTPLPGGLVLQTEAGIVTIGDNDDAEIVLRPGRFSELREVVRGGKLAPQQDVFLLQLEDFVEACRNGGPPRVTGKQGLDSLQLLEALYRNQQPLVDRWYDAQSEALWANA